jgi:hypothetical protein
MCSIRRTAIVVGGSGKASVICRTVASPREKDDIHDLALAAAEMGMIVHKRGSVALRF